MKKVELSPDLTAVLNDNNTLQVYLSPIDEESPLCEDMKLIRFSAYETEELRKLLTQPNTKESKQV